MNDEIVLLKIEGNPTVIYALSRAKYPWAKRPQVTDKLVIEVEDPGLDGTYVVDKALQGNMLELLPPFEGKENKIALSNTPAYFLTLVRKDFSSRNEALKPYKLY